MQIYVVVMFLLVLFGTLIDLAHKGSAKYFFKHRQNRELRCHARGGRR